MTNNSSKQRQQRQQRSNTQSRSNSTLYTYIPGVSYLVRLTSSSRFRFLHGWPGESVGHGKVMCVSGVGVSSGLGPVLVVWARGPCGGSVMMRALFGAQPSKLPASSCCVCGYHVPRGLTTLQRWFPKIVVFCRMFFAERSEKQHPEKNGSWNMYIYFEVQSARYRQITKESSHGRGAAEFSELLTWGAQYLIGDMAWTKFIGATRPAFWCASPNIIIRVKLSYWPGALPVRSSTAQKHLSRKVQPRPCDDSKARSLILRSTIHSYISHDEKG